MSPRAPRRPCLEPLCPELVEPGERRCARHQVRRSRGPLPYASYAWQKARKAFLGVNSWCIECGQPAS